MPRPVTITASLKLWHLNAQGWLTGIDIETDKLIEIKMDYHAEYPISADGDGAYILFGTGLGSSQRYYKCPLAEELKYDQGTVGDD